MTPTRILLAGAGGWGRFWARAIGERADAVLAGWIDIVPGQAERAAGDLGVAPAHLGSDLRAAIEKVRPDFLLDVTPPATRHEVVTTALSMGVPVMSEKPMATSLSAAREMIACSEETGVLYRVSQNYRYSGFMAALRGLIARVGPLGELHNEFFRAVRVTGFRAEMESPYLLDMAIHHFDLARYLSGADPVSVWCEEWNPAWSWLPRNGSAVCVFEMTGGLRFTYRGSWATAGLIHEDWAGAWRAEGPGGSAYYGGQGRRPVADLLGEVVDGEHALRRVTARVDRSRPAGLAGSLADMVDSLRAGATPMGECHDNIKSLAMVFAAMEASRRGRRVEVEVGAAVRS